MQILHQHTRLMGAAAQRENDLVMAMPPHEREARYHSARVEAVLGGKNRSEGLRELGLSDRITDPAVLLFRLAKRSRETRMREGEFTWSYLPESRLAELQEMPVANLTRDEPELARALPLRPWQRKETLRKTLRVRILKIDRQHRLLAIRASAMLVALIRERYFRMDLDGHASRYGILDPLPLDILPRRLGDALAGPSGIGNPRIAGERPLFPDRPVARIGRRTPPGHDVESVAAEFLWRADSMARSPSGVPPEPVLALADRVMPELTRRQREAIARALTRRLALWWGPPGTGKSWTARTYITALAGEAVRSRRPLRIAVTALTWVEIDNIARRLPALFARAGIADGVHLSRLASSRTVQGLDPALERHLTVMGDTTDPGRWTLESRLRRAAGVTVVAGTVHQLHRLGHPAGLREYFDVLLIDEASQLDVAHAAIAFSKLARGARVTVVGDPRQMPPIHPIPPSKGLEHLVGSVYDFFSRYRCHEGPGFAPEPVMLNRSFRSSREIVAFVREAGYGEDLKAAGGNAGLRIRTVGSVATGRSVGWPPDLPFSPAYARILDPADPLVAVLHDDRFSSQRNDAEAGLAAGLVLALFHAGLADPETRRPYSATESFRRGVGIVTPHRAQQAAISLA